MRGGINRLRQPLVLGENYIAIVMDRTSLLIDKVCAQMWPGKRQLSERYTRIKDTQSLYLEVSSLSSAL